MNIFNKAALQSMKNNRTRTLVTIIGVILSSAMITAVATFGVSLLDYMIKGASVKYGDWHVGFLKADRAFAQERSADPEAEKTVVFENVGYAAFEGGREAKKPYLFIAGLDGKAFDALPVTLISGRLPENSGEVLISGGLAKNAGVSYSLGDTLSLAVGSRMNGDAELGQSDPLAPGAETFVPREKKTYTVVGICRTPVFETDYAPGYTLITRTQDMAKAKDLSLFVTLDNPGRVHAYADAVSDGHSYIMNNDVLRFMGLSREASDKIFNALLYSVGCIVIAIIMIGSVFLIYNSFSISLSERTRQIGILSSVGATARQLRNSVLFEGLCIGAVGIPVGILIGLVSIWIVISVVARKFVSMLYAGVPLTVSLSAPAILAAAAVSLATILISAYIPAKKASRRPVMECIRQTGEVKVESRAVRTSRLTQRICGLEGVLALKNFKRNKKRYRSIVLSLILSVVLFISTSAFVMNLKQESQRMKVVSDYDIGFGTLTMDDDEMLRLYDQMREVPGITGSTYRALAQYTCEVRADSLSDEYWEAVGGRTDGDAVSVTMHILFLDDDFYSRIAADLGLPEGEEPGQNDRLISVAKVNDPQAEDVTQVPDMFQTSSVEAHLTQGNLSLSIFETVPPDSPPLMLTSANDMGTLPYDFMALAPWSLKENLIPDDSDGSLRTKGLCFLSDDPARSAAEIEAVIQSAGVTDAYILLNSTKLFEESRNYIFIANVFAYTFIIMISLIAVANVFNTISTNIRLRRQELAMLRSVGMGDRDFNRMMRFECAFYGMRALLFGLPTAIAACWLIYRGMFAGGADSLTFKLPWASIGISVFSVMLIIFVTMLYAVSKIKKENIIDALRDDMN